MDVDEVVLSGVIDGPCDKTSLIESSLLLYPNFSFVPCLRHSLFPTSNSIMRRLAVTNGIPYNVLLQEMGFVSSTRALAYSL